MAGHDLGRRQEATDSRVGGLGWPLRRIEPATGVRREMASAYLKQIDALLVDEVLIDRVAEALARRDPESTRRH